MAIVTSNILKGNYAASYVSSILSSQCFVRPVASDTDVGIDLYCESVKNRSPYLHFWIQVKSGKQCRLWKNKRRASCSLKKSHLEYWKRQPVPIFAALMPITKWPVDTEVNVYIVNITEYLINNDIPKSSSRSLRSDYIWAPGDNTSINRFLEEIVPRSSARMMCMHGVTAPIKTLGAQYVREFPDIPIAKYEKQVLNQIRRTAAFSIVSMRETNAFSKENEAARKLFKELVMVFKDDGHWENYMAIGLSEHIDHNYPSAIENYEESIKIIVEDPNKLKDREDFQAHLSDLNDLIQKCKEEVDI